MTKYSRTSIRSVSSCGAADWIANRCSAKVVNHLLLLPMKRALYCPHDSSSYWSQPLQMLTHFNHPCQPSMRSETHCPSSLRKPTDPIRTPPWRSFRIRIRSNARLASIRQVSTAHQPCGTNAWLMHVRVPCSQRSACPARCSADGQLSTDDGRAPRLRIVFPI